MLPTVSWGDERSFDFVFRGIPKDSVIALSTIGRKSAGEDWNAGYRAAIAAIDPELVFVVGPRLGEDLESLARVHYYDGHRKMRMDAVRKLDRAKKVRF